MKKKENLLLEWLYGFEWVGELGFTLCQSGGKDTQGVHT